MSRRLSRAANADRNALQSKGGVNFKLDNNANSESATPEDREQGKVIVQWVKDIRQRFAGYTIRRHAKSKDYSGQLLTGLAPPEEVSLHVKMYEQEYAIYGDLIKKYQHEQELKIKKHGILATEQRVSSNFIFQLSYKTQLSTVDG